MQQSDPILVQKYGGSSVADPGRLLKVARNVVAACERGYRLVVVVSAMGDSTDSLLEMAHQITPNPPRRELDMLLSAGERISMSLLSMAIQSLGVESISLTGSQSGILTNDRHFEARIIEVRPVRIQDELEKGKVVIVAGYQGVSYKREVTTLGRGGSDTTAVALAAALDAEACEIYTDVDGVYNADPRVIPDAQRLEELTFREMEELARCGARVLHAESVEFARHHGIALYVKSAQGSSGGTLIRKDRKEDKRKTFLAISCVEQLERLVLPISDAQISPLLTLLQETDASPLFADFSNQRAELLLHRENIPDLSSLLLRIATLLDAVPKSQRVVAVNVIGSDVGRDPRLLQMAQLALEAGISTPPARIFVSPLRISFLVRPEDSIEAQRILYKVAEVRQDA